MMQHANLDDNQIISLTRNVMHAIITCIRIKKQSRTKRWPSGVGGFFFFWFRGGGSLQIILKTMKFNQKQL
jgi:hypothetical protein